MNAPARVVRRASPRSPVLVESIAHMKKSLEQGATGTLVDRIDPIPAKAYDIVAKIGRVVSSAEAVERFINYPGAQSLGQHPRIVALQNDTNVAREVEQRNYLA